MEQISHPTHVLLAFQGVFSLSDQPHSLRDDGVQACVLQQDQVQFFSTIKSGVHPYILQFRIEMDIFLFLKENHDSSSIVERPQLIGVCRIEEHPRRLGHVSGR